MPFSFQNCIDVFEETDSRIVRLNLVFHMTSNTRIWNLPLLWAEAIVSGFENKIPGYTGINSMFSRFLNERNVHKESLFRE